MSLRLEAPTQLESSRLPVPVHFEDVDHLPTQAGHEAAALTREAQKECMLHHKAELPQLQEVSCKKANLCCLHFCAPPCCSDGRSGLCFRGALKS
jgi:hypothetical protein